MADQPIDDEPKISKGRSPAYPYVALEKAVEKTEKIASAGVGKAPYPPETFYKLWGSGAQSSGSRQTMAALNHFGLVQYVGRGKERKVMLSDLARRIVMDKIPNSPARVKALQEAALKPPIHSDLWKKYGHILPDDIVLATYLTMECDYNSDAAASLIGEYRDTLRYSGLDKPVKEPDDKPDDLPGVKDDASCQFSVGDHVNWESGGQMQWREPWLVSQVREYENGEKYLKVEGIGEYRGQSGWIPLNQAISVEDAGDDKTQQRDALPPLPPPPGRQQMKLSEGMTEEKNSLDEGEAILIWPKDLSPESVSDLEYWLNGILRKAKRRAGMGTASASSKDEVCNG